MRLSIITINYNGSENTIKLLKSLGNQTLRQGSGQADHDFEIIVIDNASEETDFSNLQLTIDTMQNNIVPMVIRNSDNLEFSGGNNVGIKEALKRGSEWVLLLNNDTWVEKDFIVSLKQHLEGSGGVVGLSVNEGADKIAYCGKIQWFCSNLNHVYDMLNTECLTYAIGGAVAIHKDVFDKIGFWDEKYFLYFEDADFSLRARRINIPINFIKESKVNHQASSSTKKLGSPLLLRYNYRNSLYFNWKNGPWYIKMTVWFWSFWIIKKQLLKLMFQYKPDESIEILRGVMDFYKRRMGKINL